MNKKLNYECKNGHNINNILLDEFEDAQYIDESKIICDECKDNNKYTSYKKIFYRCNKCKMNVCKNKHNKEHKIINYNEMNYICEIHNELYIHFIVIHVKKIYVYFVKRSIIIMK